MKLTECVEALIRRLETIRETNPEIHLDEDIRMARQVMSGHLEWSDRITFRHGAIDEIILRVPRVDADGNKSAVNHVLTIRQAVELGTELGEAVVANAERQRQVRGEPMKREVDTANSALSTP